MNHYGNAHIRAVPVLTVGRAPHPGTVGFDLGDAAAIAQIGAALLPAFGVKDKNVLRLADVASKGLSLAQAADKGNVRSAIQAGTQIAQRLSEQFKLGPEVQQAIAAAGEVGMGLAARELAKDMAGSLRAVNYYQREYDAAIAAGDMEKANQIYSTLYRARAQLAVDDLQLRRAKGEKVTIPLDLATEARQGPIRSVPGPLPDLPESVREDQPAAVAPKPAEPAAPAVPPAVVTPIARQASEPPPAVLPRASIPGATTLPALPRPAPANAPRVTAPGNQPEPPRPAAPPVQPRPTPAPALPRPTATPATPRPPLWKAPPRLPGSNVCVPGNAPVCDTRGTGFGTIRSSGDTSCCRIKPTERGVLIIEGSAVSAAPGAFWEAPAGDYYYVQCPDARKLTPEKWQFARPDNNGRIPACISTSGANMGQLIVPDEWSIELWSEPGFRGKTLELFEGRHNLEMMGWADKVQSMRIRGPWTIVDGLIANELGRQAKGWMTEKAHAGLLTPFRVAEGVINDPVRPEPPGRFDDEIPEWESSFRPGWEQRLSAMWTPGASVGRAMLANFTDSLKALDLLGFVTALKTKAEGIAAARRLTP